MYGHLTSYTLGIHIWQECEPNGIILRPAKNITWTPTPQGSSDILIMSIATTVYNKKGSGMINRCSFFLSL
jgi:hypothetical protein